MLQPVPRAGRFCQTLLPAAGLFHGARWRKRRTAGDALAEHAVVSFDISILGTEMHQLPAQPGQGAIRQHDGAVAAQSAPVSMMLVMLLDDLDRLLQAIAERHETHKDTDNFRHGRRPLTPAS
jgi:hypothetical protein